MGAWHRQRKRHTGFFRLTGAGTTVRVAPMRQREDLVVDRMQRLRTLIDALEYDLEHDPIPRARGPGHLVARRRVGARRWRTWFADVAAVLHSLLGRAESRRRRVPVGHHPLDRTAPEIRARQWLTK